jgi:hypothetical protein
MGCVKCKQFISKYEIDRLVGGFEVRNYKFDLCWGCGYFTIKSKINDDFTDSIMKDRTIILELIEEELMKPIL